MHTVLTDVTVIVIIIIIIKRQIRPIRRSNMARVTTRPPYNVRYSYSGRNERTDAS